MASLGERCQYGPHQLPLLRCPHSYGGAIGHSNSDGKELLLHRSRQRIDLYQISIGAGPAGWVAYGILIIMALVFLALGLMLLIKLVEAAIRIVGGVDFDRSRHVMDSGLIGVLGLLGCCGPPSESRRQRRARQQHAAEKKAHNRYRNSNSSELPPLDPHVAYDSPTFAGRHPFEDPALRRGSLNSVPTPSVLRPEHALRPYREDSDDEGYIMGAWKPFASQRSGYSPVSETLRGTPGSSPSQKQPSSGFSRVGGGKAHIDSPYSISHPGRASGSMHSFPSIGDKSPVGPGPSSLSNPVFYDGDESPPPSLSNVSNIGLSALPPGAMQPSHIRTKSQSAVIEDAGWIMPLSPLTGQITQQAPENSCSGGVASFLRPRLSSFMGSNNTNPAAPAATTGMMNVPNSPPSDDDDSERQPRKKKPWYFLKRHRPHTSEDSYMGPPTPIEGEFGGLDLSTSNSTPGRSFVVIRKNQSAGRTTTSDNSAKRTSAPSEFKTATANF